MKDELGADGLATAQSPDFTNTAKNRDSLLPVPARRPGHDCVQRQVVGHGDEKGGFSRERGHPVFPIRLPSASLSMSIGELLPGAATSNHRHAYESIMYVMAGSGYTIIEGERLQWSAGDAVYTPPWCWHQHFADSQTSVQYVTATNMPLLYRLGQTVLREEQHEPGSGA